MVRLRGVPRTAAFAWSPGTGTPLLATGTKAGAVDAEFSSDTQLELWDLRLGDTADHALQSIGKVETDSRFHDIAWVESPEKSSKGIIAGALESGSLDLWDAQKLTDGENAFVSRTSKHSGAIKALQFNPAKRELLATAGAKSELFISDIENVSSPFRLGSTAARADDFECMDWNKKVSHIMVTGSSGGFVTVWDVRLKKESLTLNNYGRKPVSAIAWDPDKSTRLITAVPLDTDPLILVWDLRNSNAPEKILRGHDGGVLSLSWCAQDSDLLLSCGKDNKTVCWNPQTGSSYGEFPVVTNWTFQTEWNPHNPNIFATASFDGKIAVHTLQSLGHGGAASSQTPVLDGEDFFNKAQSAPQVSSFNLPKAPKWLERPVGATFGFAGKLVTFQLSDGSDASHEKSRVRISQVEIDPEVSAMTSSFVESMHRNDLPAICETRVAQAVVETERTDWKVIETLISKNPRKELLSYLGFADAIAGDHAQRGAREESHVTAAEPIGHLNAHQQNGTNTSNRNRLSAFFENNAEADNFLADLASTKGAKTNNPFQIFAEDEPESDKSITQALVLGQFDRAMELSFQEGRLSDAFMIAICGGQSSIDKIQKAYFQRQASGPRYLRLLASIVGKNLWDVVYNADLQNWKEVMATLCTYASSEDFPDLCEALGDRLEEQSSQAAGSTGSQRNASFCYLAGSKLEKVVNVWIDDLESREKFGGGHQNVTSFSQHAQALQSFIEKVTVFREATSYQDRKVQENSRWKLEPLYDKYVEYADLAAAHGQLEVAESYLGLLPEKYDAGSIARARIREATRKQLSQAPTRSGAAVPSTANRALGASADPRTRSYSQQSSLYNPTMGTPSQLPYAPQNVVGPGFPEPQPTSQAPASRSIVPPPPTFGSYGQGPPRGTTSSPNVAPAKSSSIPNWNDTPEDFFKPPTSRRGTPAAQMPGPPQSQNSAMRSTSPNVGLQSSANMSRGAPPVAPPPKGPAPPPQSATPQHTQSYPQPDRPPSVAANTYAPPPASSEAAPQPHFPRGRSPYNVPPSSTTRDTANRYAPAPATQQSLPAAPSQRPPPPSNPYASRQNVSGPPPGAGPRIHGPPPTFGEPSHASPPGTQPGIPHQAPPPPPPANKGSPKHPPGDRSHIPQSAVPIFDILNDELQRVKPMAPPSFRNHVNDAEKRLNILFDHLNNESLLKPNTISSMVELAQAVKTKDYEKASAIHIDLLTNQTEECANWMPGVKRLIGMSKATP